MDNTKQDALRLPIIAGCALAEIEGEELVLAILSAYRAGLERGKAEASGHE